MDQPPKQNPTQYGDAAPLDLDKGIADMYSLSVLWMGCNNRNKKRHKGLAKGDNAHQWVAFRLIWLYKTKIVSIISTYADVKENKTKF